MNPNVITTPMNIDGREFVLAEVTRGMGQVGVFRYTSNDYSATDVLYIDNEPIIKVITPNLNDQHGDKYIAQISGSEKCAESIKARLCLTIDNLFHYNQGLARSATTALELFNPGLYVVHESQVHPSDGNGNFFWNAYGNNRVVTGTAEKNSAIGDNNYPPCFLMPTTMAAGFQAKKMYDLSDKLKSGKKLGGVALHVSGMFSALLEGHHAATACLINNTDFRCLVIEPLSGVMYESSRARSSKNQKSPKIIALTCPFINIPLEELPDNTLERFLLTRKNLKPLAFSDIKPKMTKTLRASGKRAFPGIAYDKAEQLPDCAMVESASIVNTITEEQLEALLAGEVKLTDEEGNDKFIVSSNYYSSIVVVSNYLQISDFNRFLTFAIDILRNRDLTAVHKYIAERLIIVMHPAIYEFFSSLIESKDDDAVKDGIIYETAVKYKRRWEEHLSKKKTESERFIAKRKKDIENKQAITEAKGIATLEMAAKSMDNKIKDY